MFPEVPFKEHTRYSDVTVPEGDHKVVRVDLSCRAGSLCTKIAISRMSLASTYTYLPGFKDCTYTFMVLAEHGAVWISDAGFHSRCSLRVVSTRR